MQPPHDRHRTFTGVADVRGRPEEGERLRAAPGVLVRWPDEEHDVAAASGVVDVALPRVALFAGDRLRFPVEEVGGDGVVAVGVVGE